MKTERTKVLSCRVPQSFADLVRKFCEVDMHINPADLIRDAVREKIQRDAPELYYELFQAGKS